MVLPLSAPVLSIDTDSSPDTVVAGQPTTLTLRSSFALPDSVRSSVYLIGARSIGGTVSAQIS